MKRAQSSNRVREQQKKREQEAEEQRSMMQEVKGQRDKGKKTKMKPSYIRSLHPAGRDQKYHSAFSSSSYSLQTLLGSKDIYDLPIYRKKKVQRKNEKTRAQKTSSSTQKTGQHLLTTKDKLEESKEQMSVFPEFNPV